tara:strand:+ start:1008 stop:1805 length:798 start_codon:yes stop_codon:yes gene_type:complete
MKILVIGGNRFVGKKLVNRLINESYEVTVLNRSGTGPNGVTKIKFDRNKKSNYSLIDFTKFDCIVDMCLFKPEQFELIKDSIPTDTNYIFVSSGAVDYIHTNSFGDYAIEKMGVEKALSETDLNYKIIRPSYIVGIGNHRPRLGYYISQLKNQKSIAVDGVGDYPINLVFADDVVECLVKLIYDNRKTYETYNVVGDESITINDLINFLKSELNVDTHKTENVSESLFPNQSFEFDNSKIKNEYNLNFTDLKQGITKYIEEYNEL